MKESFQKLKYIDDLNTFLRKFLSRKSFYIKKGFANNNNDLRINEMLHSKVRSSRVVMNNGKDGFRFNIYCCLKIWQNFEMEVCLLRGRGRGY